MPRCASPVKRNCAACEEREQAGCQEGRHWGNFWVEVCLSHDALTGGTPPCSPDFGVARGAGCRASLEPAAAGREAPSSLAPADAGVLGCSGREEGEMVNDAEACSKCGKEPRAGTSRWGRACLAENKRQSTARARSRAQAAAASRPPTPRTRRPAPASEPSGASKEPVRSSKAAGEAPRRRELHGPGCFCLPCRAIRWGRRLTGR